MAQICVHQTKCKRQHTGWPLLTNRPNHGSPGNRFGAMMLAPIETPMLSVFSPTDGKRKPSNLQTWTAPTTGLLLGAEIRACMCCQRSRAGSSQPASTLKPARLKAGMAQETNAGSRTQCNSDKCMRTAQTATGQLANCCTPMQTATPRRQKKLLHLHRLICCSCIPQKRLYLHTKC